MYREAINLLAFLSGLLLMIIAGTASAEPATEETLHQLSEFIAVAVMVVAFCLGANFGHQR